MDPFFKKGEKRESLNYTSVSLIQLSVKHLQQIIIIRFVWIFKTMKELAEGNVYWLSKTLARLTLTHLQLGHFFRRLQEGSTNPLAKYPMLCWLACYWSLSCMVGQLNGYKEKSKMIFQECSSMIPIKLEGASSRLPYESILNARVFSVLIDYLDGRYQTRR